MQRLINFKAESLEGEEKGKRKKKKEKLGFRLRR
jgi:hypothetical protein